MKQNIECKYSFYCNNEITTEKEIKKYVCPSCEEKKINAKLNIFYNKEYFYSKNIKKIKIFYIKNLNLKCYLVKTDFLNFKEGNILFFNKKDNMNYIGFLNNYIELTNLYNSILTNKSFLKVFKEIKNLDMNSIDEKISSIIKSIEDNYIYLEQKEKEKFELKKEITIIKNSSIFYFFQKEYQIIKKELNDKINYINIYLDYCSKEEKNKLLIKENLIKEKLMICNTTMFSENDYLKNFLNKEEVKNYLIKQIYIDLK